jgi:thiJ/pfpI family protein
LAKQENIEMTIASIRGGKVPIDPESLRLMLTDRITKKYWNDEKF